MKASYSLSKSNKIYFSIVVLLNIALFFIFSGKSASETGELVGRIFAFLTLPAIVAWVVWFLSGKKEKGGSLTFNLVLTLALLGQVLLFVENTEKNITRDDVVEELLEQREVFKQEFSKDDYSDSAYDDYAGAVKEGMNKLAESSTGSEKQLYTLLGSFVEESEAVALFWNDSFTAVESDRILDFSRLKDNAEIDFQKSTLTHYIDATKSYSDYFFNMIQIMEEKLSPLGKESKDFKDVMRGARNKHMSQKPTFEPLMETHIEYGKIMIEIIDLLEENKNKWSYENEEMIFSNNSLVDKYNKLIEELTEKETTINALSSKLNETM